MGLGIAANWQAQAPQSYWYGTTPVALNHQNVPGNWLFVAVTWGKTNDSSTPIAFVSDDAHNVYQQVSFSGSGPYLQVFAVPNAQPAGTVYVATNCYVRDLHVQVLEVQGLSSAYAVDTVKTNTGTGGTSFSVSYTASTADFVVSFAMANTTGGAAAVPDSSQGAAIERLQPQIQSSLGLAASSTGTGNGWSVSAGAHTASWSASRGAFTNWTAAVAAFKTTGTPVYHATGNPAWPQIQVRAFFGFPTGAPTAPMTTYTDLSSRFLGLSGQRGRSFELDELNAADMVLTLDNADGYLSPGNTASPYYPNCDLVTPLQVLATWQGRTYFLFYGYINSIPESFDFQRGQVKIDLSDDFTKLPQVLLQSAMIADCLYDKPSHLWPLNESQATFASNWSGVTSSTLVQVNAPSGGGSTQNTPSTGFGATNTLAGTQDSCWGEYATISTSAGTWVHGTCLADRADYNIPWSGSTTVEVWAQIQNNSTTVQTGATIFSLLSDKGALAGGMFLKLVAVNINTTGNPQTVLSCGHATTGSEGMHTWRTKNVFDNAWHHYAVTVNGTLCTLFVDGYPVGSWKAVFPAGKPTRIMFGGDTTVWNTIYGKTVQQRRRLSGLAGIGGYFDGCMSNAAIYPKVLDPERIYSHWVSGANGFIVDLTGIRIQRVLAWSNWAGPQAIDTGVAEQQIFNYLGGTYGSGGLSGAIGQSYTAGGALLDSGSQADLTIGDIALSEDGLLLIGADGRLTFKERSALFTVRSSALFGDIDYAVNKTVTFETGLGDWTSAVNGTVAQSSAWSYAGQHSAMLTCTGGQTQAYVRGAYVPLRPYPGFGASVWVMAPQACSVSVSIDWFDVNHTYIGTTSPAAGAVTVSPYTPIQLTLPPSTAPPGAVYAQFGPTVSNTPAAGTIVYFDRPRMSPGGFQVPYGDEAEITRDIQYLFNDIAVTRNVDQSTFRVRSDSSQAKYFKRTYTRVVYLSTYDAQGTVDAANWLLTDYSVPKPRVSNVKVDAASNPEAWPWVLSLDVGDVVSFARNPVQGAAFAGTFLILGVELDLEPDKADFTFTLAPLPTGAGGNALMIDQAVAIDGVKVLAW